MGLFNFVKSVGKKLGIGSEGTPPKAEDLKAELDSHNLGSSDLEVEIKDDVAVLKGQVADQVVFEKVIVAVGNTLGISSVETHEVRVTSAAGEKAEEPVLYEVKKGDTLWQIAIASYGRNNGARYTVIFEANKPMLKHPDKIYPGQILRVPPLDQSRRD